MDLVCWQFDCASLAQRDLPELHERAYDVRREPVDCDYNKYFDVEIVTPDSAMPIVSVVPHSWRDKSMN